MAKKLLSTLLIATFLLLSVGSAATANSIIDNAEDTKDEAQQEIDKLQSELADLQSQQASLIGEMDEYEAQLVELIATVEMIESQLADKEVELEQARASLEEAQAKEQKQYEDMKLRIQYMYEKGDTAFLEAILGAGSMADLLNQVSYYEEVYSYDRKLLVTYQETKLQAQELEVRVETEMAELASLQAVYETEKQSMEATLAALESQVEDYDAMMASAQSRVSEYKAIVEAQNTIIAQEEERIRQENANNGGGSSGGGISDPGYTTGVSPQAVVDYALQFVGNPYVWGGTDPNTGADCSGYVQYVYKHFGIYIPRTTWLQENCGREVSYEDMQPGDLILYEGHVAMYIGNGQMVHAKGRAYGIVVDSNIKYKPIKTIRRVL